MLECLNLVIWYDYFIEVDEISIEDEWVCKSGKVFIWVICCNGLGNRCI